MHDVFWEKKFCSFLVTTLTHSYKIICTVGGGGFEKQKSHPTELCWNPLREREEMLPFMTNRWRGLLCSSSLRNTVEYRNIMGGKHSGSKHPLSIPISPELKTHQTQWRFSLPQVIAWALSPLLKAQSWAIWKRTLLYSLFSHLILPICQGPKHTSSLPCLTHNSQGISVLSQYP